MNKRIKKKVYKRMGYKTYKGEYDNVIKPQLEYWRIIKNPETEEEKELLSFLELFNINQGGIANVRMQYDRI